MGAAEAASALLTPALRPSGEEEHGVFKVGVSECYASFKAFCKTWGSGLNCENTEAVLPDQEAKSGTRRYNVQVMAPCRLQQNLGGWSDWLISQTGLDPVLKKPMHNGKSKSASSSTLPLTLNPKP